METIETNTVSVINAGLRLEELRLILRSECISYGDLVELESLAQHIEPDDIELLEAAGIPE